jgi:hypothetical protein
VEQTNLAFTQYTLRPLVEMIERPLSTLILVPDAFVKFTMDSLLRGTTKDRFETYRIGLQEGWLSVNDIRRFEDLSPIESGDSYRMPLNEADAGIASLSQRVNIVTSLTNAGFDPEEAAAIVGVEISHTGDVPITSVRHIEFDNDGEHETT